MLFDGIRDQKIKVKWQKTPQTISCKILVARCLRDKVPKGEFVIRATVLDRLIKNKLQYKFIDHGQRIKDMLQKEKLEANRARILEEEYKQEEEERQKILTSESSRILRSQIISRGLEDSPDEEEIENKSYIEADSGLKLLKGRGFGYENSESKSEEWNSMSEISDSNESVL